MSLENALGRNTHPQGTVHWISRGGNLRKIVALSLLALSGPVSAVNATSFTDEAAWRAAVGGVFAFENFDAIAAGTPLTSLPALGIQFLPLNDGTQPTVQPYTSTGGVVRSAPNNLLNDSDFQLPGRGPLRITPINPGDLLFGLGMFNVGGDDQLRLDFVDGGGNLVESVTSAISSGFFGIVNTTGAPLAVVNFVQGNGFAPVDDFQTAAREEFEVINPVPEPATLLLVGTTAAGLGLARWKQRRRKQETIAQTAL
jgi:hypothetical protein